MTARPKLIFGSFKGISDVRIQTYTLKATTPLARAILIHGSRCHFAAEFLKYNPNYIVQNNSSQNPRHIDKHKNPLNKSTEPDHLYGEDLCKKDQLKTVGQLELETAVIDVYEDGTDAWATTNTFIYEGSFCQVLNENNITVHGMDLRSYGRSESPQIPIAGKRRGLVDDFDNLSKDVITYIENIKKENPDVIPIYLIGMSMGGGVVSRVVELYEDKKLVDGIILLSPMLSILSDNLNFLVNVSWYLHTIMSKLFPTLTIASGDRSNDPNPIERLRENDPLCIDEGIPYKTGYGMIKLVDEIHKDSAKIHMNTSVLIFHSLSDNVCFYRGSENFYNSLSHIKKKRLVTLNKIDHMITCQPFCLQIAKYVSDWINIGDSNCKLDYACDT